MEGLNRNLFFCQIKISFTYRTNSRTRFGCSLCESLNDGCMRNVNGFDTAVGSRGLLQTVKVLTPFFIYGIWVFEVLLI